MHLAVASGDLAPCVEDDGGVVVDPGRSTLEDRCDQGNSQIGGLFRQRLRRWPRNRLRPIEAAGILTLTEIGPPEEFGQADDLGALSRRFGNRVLSVAEVSIGIGLTAHLHQPDTSTSR